MKVIGLLVVLGLLTFAAPAAAAIYTVNSTADTGVVTPDGACTPPCTLREAIQESNASIGTLDTINFSFGSPSTIQLASDLPTIADPVLIDGGGTANTHTGFTALNTVLNVTIDAHDHVPFDVMSGGTTIKGLNIQETAVNNTSGFEPNMIVLRNAGGNHIYGNFIGTNRAGDSDAGNGGAGVVIESGDANSIGGSLPAQRNLISGNGNPLDFDAINVPYGIWVKGGSGATISGNLIGTSADGLSDLGNMGAGVRVGGVATAAPNTVVGGTGADDGNVLSANGQSPVQGYGIFVGTQAGTGVKILGNRIGTDVSGTGALANNPDGIDLLTDSSVQVGDTSGHGNLISGNALYGINVESSGHVIRGNNIGTNAAGSASVANQTGVYVNGQTNTTIGGTTASARNVISGNSSYGVRFASEGSDSRVQGNYIGMKADGLAKLPNQNDGVYFEGGTGNLVGGPTIADGGNVISGNNGNGVRFDTPEGPTGTSNSQVQGNYIGADKNGAPIGNIGAGVLIVNGSNNLIGGGQAGNGNLIINNEGAGVVIRNDIGTPATGNQISANSIGLNSDLGIDLAPDSGVTPNDAPPDGDSGANMLQNFPLLHSALPIPSTNVAGTLLSKPNTTFRIEFFKVADCDRSGNGEGETFLGAEQVTTDNVGYVLFNHALSPAVQNPNFITATATDPDGNTSEFSPCRLAGTSGAPQARPAEPQQPTPTQTNPTPTTTVPFSPPPPKCKDVKKPITTLKRPGLAGIGSTSLTLTGTARDPAPCASGVKKVEVSLARVSGLTGVNCRFIKRPDRYSLTNRKNCRQPTLFLARGTRNWTFTFPVDLKAGLYRVQARATDRAGNKETPKKRQNIVFFSVP